MTRTDHYNRLDRMKPPLLLSGLADNEQRDLLAAARPRQLAREVQ